MCDEADHVPDNGFSPSCWAGVEENEDSSNCSVSGLAAGRSGGIPALGLLGGAWLAVAVRVRRRRSRSA